jgi:hypothetical protein
MMALVSSRPKEIPATAAEMTPIHALTVPLLIVLRALTHSDMTHTVVAMLKNVTQLHVHVLTVPQNQLRKDVLPLPTRMTIVSLVTRTMGL